MMLRPRRLATLCLLLACAILTPAGAIAQPADSTAAVPLTLQDAVRTALEHNFGILLSREDEQIARNNFTRGNAGQLPTVTGNLTRTFTDNDVRQRFGEADPRVVSGATSNLFNTNVSLGWTVFDGLRMFIAYDRLRALSRRQQAVTRATVEETVEQVTNAYFNVVREQGKIGSLEAALRIGQARIDLTEAQANEGVAARVEVLTARVDYNADRSRLLQQQETVSAAMIRLNTLLGRPPQLEVRPVDSIVVARDLSRDSLYNRLAADNPRLAQARLGVDVAVYDRRLIRASWFPQIGLVAGYGLNRTVNNAAFAGTALTTSSARTLGFTYGLTASVPLFDGFNRRRLARNADAAEQQSRLTLGQTRLQLSAELEQAYTRYQNRLERLQLEETNIALARQSVEIALERYRLGLLTPLALREAQRSQLDADGRLLDIRYQAKEAETALRRLTGTLVAAP